MFLTWDCQFWLVVLHVLLIMLVMQTSNIFFFCQRSVSVQCSLQKNCIIWRSSGLLLKIHREKKYCCRASSISMKAKGKMGCRRETFYLPITCSSVWSSKNKTDILMGTLHVRVTERNNRNVILSLSPLSSQNFFRNAKTWKSWVFLGYCCTFEFRLE